MKRYQRLRHYGFNLAGPIVALLITIVTVPIYLRHVGDARYGVLSIVWLLLGYVGFLDLGLSRAAENALARATGDERASVLVTAAATNLVLGVIGALVVLATGSWLFSHFIEMPDEIRVEVLAALPWIAVLFPATLVAGVVNGALESRERFATANILSVGGLAVGQIAPLLCAVFLTPSLGIVVPVAVVARLLGIAAVIAVVVSIERPLRLVDFRRSRLRSLISYGGWVSVTSLLSPALVSLDQLIIGSRLGAGAVAYYAVPTNIVTRTQLVAAALSRTLFPGLSRASGDVARAEAERAATILAVLSAAGFAAMTVVVEKVLALWISQDFAATSAPVARVLLLGGWINGVAFIPYALLQAQGRPDITAKIHLAEILPYVGLLWWLSMEFGLVGAAVAWSVRTTVDAMLMIMAADLSRAFLLKLLCLFGVLLIVCIGMQAVSFSPAVMLLAAISSGFVVLVIGLAMDRQLRGDLLALMRLLAARKLSPGPGT